MFILYHQILVTENFRTFYNSLPAIRGQQCNKMQFQQFSKHPIYVTVCVKLSELHFNGQLFSNSGEKFLKSRRTMEQICTLLFTLFFSTFSPQLNNNDTSKCSSDSFPGIVTYMLLVENCQNYISLHRCPPIAGKLSQNVIKFDETHRQHHTN